MKKKLAGKIMIPIVALFIISILVFRERAGISYDETDAAVRKWEYIYTYRTFTVGGESIAHRNSI